MNILHDEIIGDLSYKYGWVKRYSIPFLGSIADVQLVIPCDEADEIEDAQRSAFNVFDAGKDLYLQQAEAAIFDHYLNVCAEYREKFGTEFADEIVPIVERLDQMQSLINASHIIIQQSFGSDNRIVGLLLSCSWEPELGLAVKFVNEVIDEVGPQDIVL